MKAKRFMSLIIACILVISGSQGYVFAEGISSGAEEISLDEGIPSDAEAICLEEEMTDNAQTEESVSASDFDESGVDEI